MPMSVSADGIYVVTSSKKLNVRNKPSTSGYVITQLRPGQEVICGEATGNWMEVKLNAETRGYASKDYLAYSRPYQQNHEVQQSSSNYTGWWQMSTGKIIILILISGALIWFFTSVIEIDGIVGLILVALAGGSYFGAIVGLLSWWIFDNFWSPYLFIMGGWFLFALIKYLINQLGDNSVNSEDASDWSYYASSSSSDSSSSSSSSYTRSFSNNHYDYNDDNDEDEERERLEQEQASRHLRTADDYYSKYEYYSRLAEEAESQADTEERYADDYSWRAREFSDSSYARQADECRSSAARYRYKARQHSNEADRYYDLYCEYKSKAGR